MMLTGLGRGWIAGASDGGVAILTVAPSLLGHSLLFTFRSFQNQLWHSISLSGDLWVAALAMFDFKARILGRFGKWDSFTIKFPQLLTVKRA